MNKEERLELENELLMTCSKAQAINKYIDELEENMILTNQWYKSQQENKQLKEVIETLKETNKLLLQQKGQLQEDLDMLDNRIDKAIEYLEEPNRDSFDYSKALLLEILLGENNE